MEPVLRAWLGRFGVFRRSLEHQRLVNLAETYLPGPPVPIDVLGAAPVLDLLPIAPLTGNLALSFVALSYAGRSRSPYAPTGTAFPISTCLWGPWRRTGGGSRDRHGRTGPEGRRPAHPRR